MSGFKDKIFNRKIAQSMMKDIVVKVLQCSKMMLDDYVKSGRTIQNHEEDIRNALYDEYLNDNKIVEKIGLNNFYFEAEVPENYQNHKSIGRVDLKVINKDIFNQRDAYFIIECKRIDGNRRLNKAYVVEGINRFLSSEEKGPKYSSYYGTNCMLGIVVKQIDIDENMKEINLIHQKENNVGENSTNIDKYVFNPDFTSTYVSEYTIDEGKLKLYHMFYDYSSIIKE